MMAELRAGGLALVVGDNEHTGKMVSLIELAIPGKSYVHPITGHQEFMHKSVDFPCWVVTGNVWPFMCRSEKGWALFSPSLLRPIDDTDPDAADEREKDKLLTV